MGLDTIPTRGEDVIQTEWFNVLKSVLTLDLVPRNANGVPADKAGSAGTADYQFKNIRAENIYVNGELVDPSLATSRPYRISSAKADSTGAPDYLSAAGSGNGLSADLDASSTDLETTINNSSVVVAGTTLTFSSLTAAPSSNNTCQVNDSDLPGFWSDPSKIRGEYDDRAIAIDNIGSEISNLDGTVAAFKVGSEVFLAEVDTTNNQLLPILRGWAGTDRGTVSNNDTITLLKLNTLLLKSDGVTKVSSTYYPESVTTAPAAGTAGKVYFERETQKQGYDDGASISYDYLVVGYAVCDDTDCLWVHHPDFDLIWKEKIAVDFRIVDSTTVRIRRGSVANVQGQDVAFHDDLDIDQSSDMDSGESAAANTVFYIYLKSDGSAVFSTVAPRRYDPLKAGFYHPLKYFRCIGSLITDGSNNWLLPRQRKASYEDMAEAMAPVGSILAWIPGYFGNSTNGSYQDLMGSNSAGSADQTLPPNWRVCDGSEVDDPESPIFNGTGRHLPDLTDSRFLMGSTAGSTGGANTRNIDHRHNIAHVHQVAYGNKVGSNASEIYLLNSQSAATTTWNTSHAAADETISDGADASSGGFRNSIAINENQEYYSAGVLSGPSGSGSSAKSGTMESNTSFDNRPKWLSCFYIMRVK